MIVSKDDFLKLFNAIAQHKNRYEVFFDFVAMSAISLHNACAFSQELEDEYMTIVDKYEKDDVNKFPELFSLLVQLYDDVPTDLLGDLFMELDLGNERNGQFFTPFHVCELMAKLTMPIEDLMARPFATVSDPACGAGALVLAIAKAYINEGFNPTHKMWASCIDIDSCAAYMCYVQLTLWNIPGEVVFGDTLRLKLRRVMRTPAHYAGGWNQLLAMDEFIRFEKETVNNSGYKKAKPSTPDNAEKGVELDTEPLLDGDQFTFKF